MPSNKILEVKKAQVSGLADELKEALTLVVADHRGLTVEQDTELRKAVREAGVEYKVVKNTMLKLAAKQAGIEGMDDFFAGPSAIAFSKDDIIAPAKIMQQYADKLEKFELKGGYTDGKVSSLAEIKALASIPPVEVLYGKLVGSLISPIAGLAMLLDQIRQKTEEAGAETAAAVAVVGAGSEVTEA
ncbi:50S ribosomal protein L10 [Oscillospiraceae bacterium HV4-5-C5C]|nr:50S ribosomal protein L10 [Oscillospiraceae bacterium HV4-5-C5C]